VNERTELVSPQTAAIYGLAGGHTLWGLYAYGDQVKEILRELPGSVGDGIFDKGHSLRRTALGSVRSNLRVS